MLRVIIEVDYFGLGFKTEKIKEYRIVNQGQSIGGADDERVYECTTGLESFEVKHRRSEGAEVLVKKMFDQIATKGAQNE